MTLKTIYHNILIKPIKEDINSPITIEPDKKSPIKGTVEVVPNREPTISNGIESYFEPLTEGMMVWFFPKDATEIEVEKEKYLIVDDRNILLIEEE